MISLALLEGLSPRQRATHQRDLVSAFFFGVTFGILEMIPGLAIRLMDAGEWSVYVLRAAQPAALLLTMGWASLAEGRQRMPALGALRLLSAAFLALSALAVGNAAFFALLIALYYAADAGALPIQSAIFNENYPDKRRHALVANGRAVTMLAGALAGILAGRYIEARGLPAAASLGRLQIVLAASSTALAIGVWIFASIRLKSDKRAAHQRAIGAPAQHHHNKGWKRLIHGFHYLSEHREFRHFMIGYFVFGVATHMYRPALDFYIAKDLHVSVEVMGLLYSALPLTVMFLTLVPCGRMLDRMDPAQGRILFNAVWMLPIGLAAISVWMPREWAIGCLGVSKATEGYARAGSSLIWHLGALHYARRREEAVAYAAIGMALTGLRGLTAPALALWLQSSLGLTAGWLFLICLGFLIASTWLLDWLRRNDQAREAARLAAEAAAPAQAASIAAAPEPRVVPIPVPASVSMVVSILPDPETELPDDAGHPKVA